LTLLRASAVGVPSPPAECSRHALHLSKITHLNSLPQVSRSATSDSQHGGRHGQ